MASRPGQGKTPPAVELSKEQARRIFGECVDRAFYTGQRTIITKRGRQIAAIVPIDDVNAQHAAA